MDMRPTASRARGRRAKQVQQTTQAEVQATTPIPVQRIAVHPIDPHEDLHERIQKRAYELHAMRGYREGLALDDWLQAEREILSQVRPM
jgi:hypothetical protein